jgi:hypothetical protein
VQCLIDWSTDERQRCRTKRWRLQFIIRCDYHYTLPRICHAISRRVLECSGQCNKSLASRGLSRHSGKYI